MADNGWGKFAKYVGIQGVLAVILLLSILGMVYFRIEVPRELWALLGLSWGFFFAKNGNAIAQGVTGKTGKTR